MTANAVTVIIPVKGGAAAKSRLHDDAATRSAFARAFALDTAAAALAAVEVGRVVVVTRDAGMASDLSRLGCHVVTEQRCAGRDPLNAAITQARVWAARHHPDRSIAVLPGDLPALTPTSLDDALNLARSHRLAFCPDIRGVGTTLLVAARPSWLKAGYGRHSAMKHRAAGAIALEDADRRIRLDVDTMGDLWTAREFGLGPATEAVVSEHVSTWGAQPAPASRGRGILTRRW